LRRRQARAHFQKITLQSLVVLEHLGHKIHRVVDVVFWMCATGTLSRFADMFRRHLTQMITFIASKKCHVLTLLAKIRESRILA
jgi:hypothetical protein